MRRSGAEEPTKDRRLPPRHSCRSERVVSCRDEVASDRHADRALCARVEQSAVLCLSRERSRWVDRLRTYRVLLDGTEVARLANGTSTNVSIAPGAHTLRLKLDIVGSTEQQFDAAPGQQVEFVCRAGVHPFFAWITFIEGLWRRDKWINLERRS
jgi:hypothetical protein